MGFVGLLYMYLDGMSHQNTTNVDKIYHCYHKNEESFCIFYYAVYTVESQKNIRQNTKGLQLLRAISSVRKIL